MKKHWSIPLFLSLALAGAAPAPLALGSAAAPASPSFAAPQAQTSNFRERLAQARKLGAFDEIGKLLQQHNDEAVLLVFELCLQASRKGSDDIEQQIQDLRTAWKTTYKSDFVLLAYEYYALLSPEERKEHYNLEVRYSRLETRTQKAIEAKDVDTLIALQGEWRDLSLAFKEMGDMQYMALAGMRYFACTGERHLGERADLKRACESLGMVVEARETWQLVDKYYNQSKDAYAALVGLGYGPEGTQRPPAGGAAPAAAASAPSAAAAPVEIELAFEAVPQLEQFQRPGYDLDMAYATWPAVWLEGKGSSREISSFPSGSRPNFTRTASAEVSFDGNRDAQPDATLKITGNLELLEFDIGSGEEQRRWACLWVTLTDKEIYQGMEVNLQPDDKTMALYTAPAASMVGTLAGVPVRVFDDNMDGTYGSAPLTWGFLGLVDQQFQPNMDSIAIGSSKRARPWSELQQIGNTWYKLEPKRGGRALVATPTSVQTGTLKLEYKGPAPARVIVKSRELNNYYDLVEGGAKGVQVPVGRYDLYTGFIREGKRRDVVKALILPGAQPISVDVAVGATAVMKLGGPYGFDFKFEADDGRLNVLGETVAVVGAAGERYERPWGCRALPEFSWRKAGSKKSEKPQKLQFAMDSETLGKEGWDNAYLPLNTMIEIDKGLGALEVQLTQKKHPLFGSVESAWKK